MKKEYTFGQIGALLLLKTYASFFAHSYFDESIS